MPLVTPYQVKGESVSVPVVGKIYAVEISTHGEVTCLIQRKYDWCVVVSDSSEEAPKIWRIQSAEPLIISSEVNIKRCVFPSDQFVVIQPGARPGNLIYGKASSERVTEVNYLNIPDMGNIIQAEWLNPMELILCDRSGKVVIFNLPKNFSRDVGVGSPVRQFRVSVAADQTQIFYSIFPQGMKLTIDNRLQPVCPALASLPAHELFSISSRGKHMVVLDENGAVHYISLENNSSKFLLQLSPDSHMLFLEISPKGKNIAYVEKERPNRFIICKVDQTHGPTKFVSADYPSAIKAIQFLREKEMLIVFETGTVTRVTLTFIGLQDILM